MTVSTTNSTQLFSGGQSTLTFTFQALPGQPSDIKVIERITATGYENTLVYSTDYTVSINSSGIGGTVTISPTYSTAYTQIVYRDTTLTQASDYDDYNQFPAETLETNLDRLTMIAQEHDDQLNDYSNKISAWVKFDGTGSTPITPTAVYAVSSSVLKPSTGTYVITFSPTLSTTSYGVILSGGGTTNFLCAKLKDGSSASTTNISISTINTSFAAVDTAHITVAIIKN